MSAKKKIETPKITTTGSLGWDDGMYVKHGPEDIEQANNALKSTNNTSLKKTIMDWLTTRLEKRDY